MLGLVLAMAASISDPVQPAVAAPPIPSTFESFGPDRMAIETILNTYTRAVSTKDQKLFETLLLNEHIPFSSASMAISSADRDDGSRNYPDFRKGVFEGEPFTQKFQDVQIRQDGPLADVSLVFVNTSAKGTSWGWKTLQLLKMATGWKIASEFYTSHR